MTAADAIARAAADVASAPEGRRNITLNRAAFRLARLALDGVVDEPEARHRLLIAATAGAGLPEREARVTIRRAFAAARPEACA